MIDVNDLLFHKTDRTYYECGNLSAGKVSLPPHSITCLEL